MTNDAIQTSGLGAGVGSAARLVGTEAHTETSDLKPERQPWVGKVLDGLGEGRGTWPGEEIGDTQAGDELDNLKWVGAVVPPNRRFDEVEARNIANKAYISSVSVIDRATPTSPLFEPGSGRAVYVGAKARW